MKQRAGELIEKLIRRLCAVAGVAASAYVLSGRLFFSRLSAAAESSWAIKLAGYTLMYLGIAAFVYLLFWPGLYLLNAWATKVKQMDFVWLAWIQIAFFAIWAVIILLIWNEHPHCTTLTPDGFYETNCSDVKGAVVLLWPFFLMCMGSGVYAALRILRGRKRA